MLMEKMTKRKLNWWAIPNYKISKPIYIRKWKENKFCLKPKGPKQSMLYSVKAEDKGAEQKNRPHKSKPQSQIQ